MRFILTLITMLGLVGVALGQSASDDPLPPLDLTDEPPDDWAQWEGVNRLLGVSQANLESGSASFSDTSRRKETRRQHATVFMELTRKSRLETGGSRDIQWRVTSASAEAGAYFDFFAYYKSGGDWLGTEGSGQGSYAGPLSLRVDPSFYFNLDTGIGTFDTLHETATPWFSETTALVTEIGSVSGKLTTRTVQDSVQEGSLEDSLITFTAPKPAVPFTAEFHLDSVTDGGKSQMHRTATVQIWPDWEDVELEMEIDVPTDSSPSFLTWRPEGNTSAPDQPGPHPLRIKATLRPKTAGADKSLPTVRRFRFELAKTSREPGVCLNWPVPAGDTPPTEDPEFDLRFGTFGPDLVTLSPKKQKASVRPLPDANPAEISSWVFLDCYDFGAHADLQVFADLADGRSVVGYLRMGDDKRYLVRVPDRKSGTRIARKWRADHHNDRDDSSDEDDQPRGDGQKGDGFSLYEEYRGFRVNGAHLSTRPMVKDLFIRNQHGGPVSAACRSLEINTAEAGSEGLAIWDTLKSGEWHSSRIMNLNRSADSPRTSDEPQHGLLVLTSPAKGEAIVSFADIVADPPRPATTKALYVHRKDNSVATIAHEIAHAIGVEHHGEIDYYARWDLEVGPALDGTKRLRHIEQRLKVNTQTGVLTPTGGVYPIRVLESPGGDELVPKVRKKEDWPQTLFIAQIGGQHSGRQLCLMRYNSAGAYIPKGQPLDRVLTRRVITYSVPGADIHSLCPDCQGTGINPARFGHANRGNCLSQICVRDSAPWKPAPTGLCPNAP
ncbi:MAG: hypothetical protein IT581_22510 [Verrucomicrobiales bacterium]|nr:hypothetical protein [Verrucomicrobiales bacterium]